MCASLRNAIRTVEPQKMIHNIVNSYRRRFLANSHAASTCEFPVPPRVQAIIAELIHHARYYQPSVKWVDHTNMVEAKVQSRSDPTLWRRVIFSNEPQTPPSCCLHSTNGSSFPCWHGVAAIIVKHGEASVHKFVSPRHLTSNWRQDYDDISFQVPTETDLEHARQAAHIAINTGGNTLLPVAISPPRGRPPKDASKRLISWYQDGFKDGKKKRKYTCSLCEAEGHTFRNCPLRQHEDEQGPTS